MKLIEIVINIGDKIIEFLSDEDEQRDLEAIDVETIEIDRSYESIDGTILIKIKVAQ